MTRNLPVRRVIWTLLITWSMPALWERGQGLIAASIKDPLRLNFACASQGVMADSGIQAFTRGLASRLDDKGVRVWGDRAVAVDLNHDSLPEYLAPLSCGATCNCTWAVIAKGPTRTLGLVDGCVVDLSLARRGWAEVTTYTHLSSSEGTLTTYAYKDGGYRKKAVATLKPHVAESYERCKDNKTCCP